MVMGHYNISGNQNNKLINLEAFIDINPFVFELVLYVQFRFSCYRNYWNLGATKYDIRATK